MGEKQFTRLVGGSGGSLKTSATGVIETDNYDYGGALEDDGTGYPLTLDPGRTIQVLHITDAGDVDLEVTTVGGDTFSYSLDGGTGVIDWWQIDSLRVLDTNATGATFSAAWGGE